MLIPGGRVKKKVQIRHEDAAPRFPRRARTFRERHRVEEEEERAQVHLAQ